MTEQASLEMKYQGNFFNLHHISKKKFKHVLLDNRRDEHKLAMKYEAHKEEGPSTIYSLTSYYSGVNL